MRKGWVKPRGLSRWTQAAVFAANHRDKRQGEIKKEEQSWHGYRPFLGWNCICFFVVAFYIHVLLHGGNLGVSYHEYFF